MSSPGRRAARADALSRAARCTREREPEDEELVEREPGATHLGLGSEPRSVHRDERVRAEREPPGYEHAGGRSSPTAPHERERLGVEVAKLLLGDLLGGRVDGREARPSRSRRRGRRRRRRSRAVRTAADTDRRARGQPGCEPRLVEPRRLDLARVVRDAGSEDLEPPAPAARHRADDPFDDGLLVAEEIADPLARRGLLVPPRSAARARRRRSRARGFASRRASVGPTPCSVSTDASSRSGRGAERGRGQASGGERRRSRPAAPLERASRSQPQDHHRSGAREARQASTRACTASRAASETSRRRARRAGCPRGGGRAPTSSPSARSTTMRLST